MMWSDFVGGVAALVGISRGSVGLGHEFPTSGLIGEPQPESAAALTV
jgi:hypothetical protein